MLKDLSEQSEVAAQLRKKITNLELEAEKLQQNMMMRLAADHGTKAPPSPNAAAQNLAQYCQLLHKSPDKAALRAIATVIREAYHRGS